MYFVCGTNLGMTPPLGGIYRPKPLNRLENLYTLMARLYTFALGRGGVPPPGGGAPGGPEGGGPPRGGPSRGGVPPNLYLNRQKKGPKRAKKGGSGGPSGGGTPPQGGVPSGGLRGGPGGALEGGGPPPGGGSRGGGTPPWGGQKGVKRGQKVANQGGTLGAPLFALGIPYRNGPWQAKKTVRGAKKGPFWGGTPPLGGVSRGGPPPPGGGFWRL